ncbi:Ankyrin repeat protein 1 [Giardia muris]|uniref:Ankyrin repeat protein 1 n=1 Tax=Giardia muris TaxID=5742 RepID=A0A4Z1SVA4_GIAMU|nr:Ankyrin repeat protein 1 [Giardia muris]|eukprot:TNJ29590.1 Ankyrin repeat protein 1 [Giardia muris]
MEDAQDLRIRERSYASLFLTALGADDFGELERILANPMMDFTAYSFDIPPIHLCAANNNVSGLVFLLKNGFDVNALDGSCGNGTILHRAAISGSEDIAKIALQFGVGINIQDSTGNTALHQALTHDHLVLAEMILNAGADPRILNNSSFSPYHIAISRGRASSELLTKLPKLPYDWKVAKENHEERLRNTLLFNPDDLKTKLKKPKEKGKTKGKAKGKK